MFTLWKACLFYQIEVRCHPAQRIARSHVALNNNDFRAAHSKTNSWMMVLRFQCGSFGKMITMQQTIAMFCMELGPGHPTEDQLRQHGGVFDGEWWKFPDGSKGKFTPYHGAFTAFDE
jgi:hypothetical protein